jgi:hypothetical protein
MLNQRTFWIHVFALMVLVGVALAGTANAQSRCDAVRIKEYGKKLNCLAKLDAKAAQKAQSVNPVKEQRCLDTFAAKCDKAEKYGDCTSAVLDCAALMTWAGTCRNVSTDFCSPAGRIEVGGECWFVRCTR